jgi:TPR repeat protein
MQARAGTRKSRVGAGIACAIALATTTGCNDMDRLRLKAMLGGTNSQVELANRYGTGDGVEQSEEEAVRWYRRAAEGGNALSQLVMGNRYASGIGVEKDPVEAFAWYEKAAAQGMSEAQFRAGWACFNGVGTDLDVNRGMAYIEQAAMAGSTDGLRVMAAVMRDGRVTFKDPNVTATRFRQLAEAGNLAAGYALGVLLLQNGQDAETRAEGLRWITSAAEGGEVQAQAQAGQLLLTTEDPKRGVAFLEKAAEAGHTGAMHALGLAYLNGQGVPADPATAASWLRKGAEAGDVSSQTALAQLYRTGKGVEQSGAEAARWLRAAADSGSATAQHNLGVLYSEGKAVPKSPEQAVKWFRMAAEQGHPMAQSALGSAYLLGNGAEQDLVQALMWYELAARGGNENGAQLSHNLQAQLDDAQRARVSELVEQWQADHSQQPRAGS